MNNNLYVTGAEYGSGKSVVVLAIMDILAGLSERIGIFRPVIQATPDDDALLHLLTDRYRLGHSLELSYGCDGNTARSLLADDRYDELQKRILEKYTQLEAECDYVLCAGTDFSSASGALEFDFNIDVANNLGCIILPVVRGQGRTSREVVDACASFMTSLRDRDCDIAAAIINRIDAALLDDVGDGLRSRLGDNLPVYLIAEDEALSKPTVGEIAQALGAEQLYGDADDLNREVSNFKIAAMALPDFLAKIEDGSLVITPSDRADIVLGSLLADQSHNLAKISGLLLTGDLPLADTVKRLIDGLGKPPTPVISVSTDTYTTATDISAVHAAITPENERKIAVALGLFEQAVDVESLQARIASIDSTRVTPLMFEHQLISRARSVRKRIVLPEGSEERILRAAEILSLRKVVDITLLGDTKAVREKIDALGLQLRDVDIIDPNTSALRERFAEAYYELRKHKGISLQMAFDTMGDVSYFGTMLVHQDEVDGMVSGSVHTTQHTVRPAFEIIRARPGTAVISSVFFMCLEDRVMVYGDCAINPKPNARQLADIAISSADTAAMFGIEPRIAMLSYSTGTSGKGGDVDMVREATAIARELRPELLLEGPIQYDAAVDEDVARTKLPDSTVAGRATVCVFPDLNTGNNTYKAVQRSAGAVAVGPVLQGLNKPVNDLSRGCTVADIVNTVAITAIQSQTGAVS